MQVAPGIPHCDADGVMHVAPLQHPLGHEVALQTQVPPTHCWPAEQGWPEPHVQAPVLEQPSAVVGSHATHALPPLPQAVSDRGLQLGPEQHPLAHVIAHPEHRPSPWQVSFAGQLAHALPPLPH